MTIENEFTKNFRHYPRRIATRGLVDPRKDDKNEWETIEPMQIVSVEEWEDQKRTPSKKIHDHGAYGIYDDKDDQNAWGEDGVLITSEDEDEDNKYRPGHYPDEEEYVQSRQDEVAKHYNRFVSHDKNESEHWKWLITGVIAGGKHPTMYMTDDLVKENLASLRRNFRSFVSLHVEQPDYKKLDFFETSLHIPTPDGQANDLLRMCQFFDNERKVKRPVLVFDISGQGRTGTALAAYLIYLNELSVEEAIKYVRMNYSKNAVDSKAQETELRKLAASI